jgi:flavin reductase
MILSAVQQAEPDVIDTKTYRDAMARLGAAVNIITTDGPGGRRGFTASAVCSVTDFPPTLLVCLNRTSDSNAALKANGVLCLNTLRASQQHLSPMFAGMTEHDYDQRFAAAPWVAMPSGSLALDGALASFDGHIVETMEMGTHTVFFVEVDAVRTTDGPALVYYARGYHTLPG